MDAASMQVAIEAEGLCKGFLYKRARPKGPFQFWQVLPASFLGGKKPVS